MDNPTISENISKDYDKRLSSNGLKVLKIKTEEFLKHDEILRYGLDSKEEIFVT